MKMGICDDPPKVKRKRKGKKRKLPSLGRNAGTRERYKTDFEDKTIGFTTDERDYGRFTYSGPTTYVGNKHQYMYDTHGFQQNWMNPCYHTRFQTSQEEILEIIDSEGLLGTFAVMPSVLNSVTTNHPYPPPCVLDDFALKAQEEFQSIIESKYSLVNFLIELWEVFTDTIDTLRKLSFKVSKAIALFFSRLAQLMKSRPDKVAANYWLAWNFAIKPTIADIKSILCSINDTNAARKKLLAVNGKTLTEHYGRKLDWAPSPGFTWDGEPICFIFKTAPGYQHLGGTWKYRSDIIQYEVKAVASARIHYDIPDWMLQPIISDRMIWATISGLSNPFGIVWEALPFSWLIDYLLTRRGKLWQNALDGNPYNRYVTVLESGYNITIKSAGRVHAVNPLGENRYVSTWTFDLFGRTSGLPLYEDCSSFTLNLSGYRQSILAGLGVSLSPIRRR